MAASAASGNLERESLPPEGLTSALVGLVAIAA
jgi:hypothetical protein